MTDTPKLSNEEIATLRESVERVEESLRLNGEAFHLQTGHGSHYYGTDLRNLANATRWWLNAVAGVSVLSQDAEAE